MFKLLIIGGDPGVVFADRAYAPGEFLPLQAFLQEPADLPFVSRTVDWVLAGPGRP